MNAGELKFQNVFFNPQTQLKSDWFGKIGESGGFDDVLKSKKVDLSERTPDKAYKNLKNEARDRSVKVGFEQKARVDFGARRSDGEDLKTLIRDGVAQNKFHKENSPVKEVKTKNNKEVVKKTVEEELEDLQAMINEALGLDQEKPTLEAMAEAVGISLEELTVAFEGLMNEEVDSEPMMKVLETLTTENVMKFIEGSKQILMEQPIEKQEMFAAVLEPLLKELTNEDVKLELETLTLVAEEETKVSFETTQKVAETTPVAEATVTESKEAVKTEVNADIQKINNTLETADKDIKVEAKAEVEKTEIPVEQKSMVTEVVKTKTTSTQGTISFEEQVNLMKSETSVISSAKGEVKVPIAKHVMNQVIQGTKMSIQMTDQGSEMLIKLNPKNLGNVALKMAFEKGTLMAEIQVENQTVKSIIESNLDQLKNALKEEGYNIGDLDVSVNKENTGQDQQSFNQTFKQQESNDSFEEEQDKIISELKVNNKEIDYFA